MSERVDLELAELAGRIRHRLGDYGYLSGGAPGPIDREIVTQLRPVVGRLRGVEEAYRKLQEGSDADWKHFNQVEMENASLRAEIARLREVEAAAYEVGCKLCSEGWRKEHGWHAHPMGWHRCLKDVLRARHGTPGGEGRGGGSE